MKKVAAQIPFETVLKEELKHIRKTPGKKGTTKDNLISLCISGGGIRSAAFGLGVIHALVSAAKLAKIDYLSTVSGGGYIGSALTWALHQTKVQGEAILEKDEFPLGQPGEGSRTSSKNDRLNYIRQQTNYMCPGEGLNLLSTLSVFFRGMILGILAYFPMLALLLYAVRPWQLSNIYIGSTIGFGLLFISLSILFSIATYLAYRFYFDKERPGSSILAYKLTTIAQNIQGKLAIGLFLSLYLWSLKPVAEFLQGNTISTLYTSITTAVGYLGFMGQFIRSSSSSKPTISGAIIGQVFGFLFLYGLSLFAYMIAEFHPTIVWVGVGVSIIIGLFVNINMVGLHRMYRDRLMETFLPDDEMVNTQKWSLAKEADQALISSMCDTETPGPYHICCGTVTLKSSKDRKVRGRLGDSFIMSPLYCGSSATSWQETSSFMKGKLQLSTAMAISAAAINPNMGCSGIGLTTQPLISFILTLLNVRMGYWAPNPNHKNANKGWTPNFFFPGLQDLLGYGYTEKSAFLELTDGGDFENLALYEMIRRKVKVALVIDAGVDLATKYESLGNAIEKVRVDFGVNILFDDPEYDLQWMLLATGEKGPFQTQYGTAKRGFAIGSIYYPDGSKGKLFFIKATMTNDLPSDIYAYKSDNPDFPNETTANQFFTEQQFEAYRELGYRLGSSLFNKLDKNWNLKKED